jgi:hypothetical protein
MEDNAEQFRAVSESCDHHVDEIHVSADDVIDVSGISLRGTICYPGALDMYVDEGIAVVVDDLVFTEHAIVDGAEGDLNIRQIVDDVPVVGCQDANGATWTEECLASKCCGTGTCIDGCGPDGGKASTRLKFTLPQHSPAD